MSLSVERLSSSTNNGRDPIVLLSGWGFDSRAMAPLAQALQPLADVWLVDLPGFGGSSPLLAWRCEQVLEQLASVLPNNCQLIGWSLGGMLALAYAQRYPTRVSGLVTLGSNGCFVAQPSWPDAMAPAAPCPTRQNRSQSSAAGPCVNSGLLSARKDSVPGTHIFKVSAQGRVV